MSRLAPPSRFMSMPNSTPAASPAPEDLLPARMLNEFIYCPRLFYYEHVEGVFLHSEDTKRGAAEHTRVDSGKGELPEPAAPSESENSNQKTEAGESPSPAPATEETIHARSVMLGSAALGVVAKLDLVEVRLEASRDGDVAPGLASAVCPVEYKTGAPRDGEDGNRLWPADRMQLGLQILLLRENGYTCTEGVVFYRQTRQRVRFAPTAEDEAWIRRGIAAARACTKGPIPAPLDHSPKCPRCSLAPVCMPDETRFLKESPADDSKGDAGAKTPGAPFQLMLLGVSGPADEGPPTPLDPATLAAELSLEDPTWGGLPEARLPRPASSGEVRRLMAPDVDTKVLYVNTPGVAVTRKGETVVVKDQAGTLAEVRIKDLHHLAVFGSAQISTALVQTLCEKEVPISHFSMGGWFYGLTRGHGLTNVFTRIRQFAFAADSDKALTLARLFVYGKIRNQRTLMMRNHIEPPPVALRALRNAASAALIAPNLPSLLGVEGAAALVYFQNFSGMIKGREETDEDELPGLEDSGTSRARDAQKEFPFDFTTRNRRPPRDPVNAMLSLAYSLLARDCTVAALAVGFDPYVGLCHQPRFGRPALALDVMEEFRPLIADSVVLTAINNRMITPIDFVRAGDAVNLTPEGRKRFFLAYEKRLGDTVTHPLFDYKVSYRRAIELQFRLLARTLTGEIECYLPFMTR